MIDQPNEKPKSTESVEDYSNRIFWFALGLIPIFGLPAIVAVLAGRYLAENHSIDWPVTLLFLAIAFVFSWVIVIRQYLIFKREWQESHPHTRF